jgi:hypothetical protein
MTWSTPVIEDWSVPKGTIYSAADFIAIHPRDMLIQRMGKNRLPWEARMTLGYRELERDRRRKARGLYG